MKFIISLVLVLLLNVVIISCFNGSETPPVPAGPNTQIQGYLDEVKFEDAQFKAIGWAASQNDKTPITKVTVYLNGKMQIEARLGSERPDVAEATKNPNWKNSGWLINKQITLPKGDHTVYAVAEDNKGSRVRLINDKNFSVQ